MDLLGDYSESEGEEQPKTKNANSPSQDRPNAAPAPPRPNAAPEPTSLFNPFAAEDGDRTASNSNASPSGGKRNFTQVTGSGPLRPSPPKASKTTAGTANAQGPRPAFNTALVPPQLRNGRANVSTEDVEKIFTKRNVPQRPQKEQ